MSTCETEVPQTVAWEDIKFFVIVDANRACPIRVTREAGRSWCFSFLSTLYGGSLHEVANMAEGRVYVSKKGQRPQFIMFLDPRDDERLQQYLHLPFGDVDCPPMPPELQDAIREKRGWRRVALGLGAAAAVAAVGYGLKKFGERKRKGKYVAQ